MPGRDQWLVEIVSQLPGLIINSISRMRKVSILKMMNTGISHAFVTAGDLTNQHQTENIGASDSLQPMCN